MKQDSGNVCSANRRGHNAFSSSHVLVATLPVFSLDCAHGVILFRTADPSANTTVPTNDPAGSGWNYEGQFAGEIARVMAKSEILLLVRLY